MGADTARKVVIENTNLIADKMINFCLCLGKISSEDRGELRNSAKDVHEKGSQHYTETLCPG